MNKVKQIREALDMDTAEFARLLGIPYMTVKNWELDNRLPKSDRITLFGKKIPNFNVDFFYKNNAEMFLNGHINTQQASESRIIYRNNAVRSVPVYGKVAAGLTVALWDNKEMTIEISHPVLNKIKKEVYGFIVIGDSMLPRFRKDDILITRKLDLENRERPKDRDFAVTVFKNESGTSEANIKLFSWKDKKKKEFILSSINAYHPPSIHNFREVRYMFKVYLAISEISYNEKI